MPPRRCRCLHAREGARLYDVDGNVHIDYVLGNGPAILGHAPGRVIEAVAASLGEGQLFAASIRARPSSPSGFVVCCGRRGRALRDLRHRGVLMALRLARAFTGRDKS